MWCPVYFIDTDEIPTENTTYKEEITVTVLSWHLEAILWTKFQKNRPRLSGKLSCNWQIMLVTMVTPISSHVKDKNSIFTARNEDVIF